MMSTDKTMENKIIIKGLLAFTAVNDFCDVSKYFVDSTRGRNLKKGKYSFTNNKHKIDQERGKALKSIV